MRTLIYTRSGNTIKQVVDCTEFIWDNGLEFVGATDSRDEIASAVIKGEIDVVLVYSKSRLSRRTDEYKRLTRLYNKYGVTIKAVNE